MTDEELQKALAGARGEEAQSDAILLSVRQMLEGSRNGVVPGYNLGVSGIYPSFSVEHHDDRPENAGRVFEQPQGFRVLPAWDKRVFRVTPAAWVDLIDEPVGKPRVVVPTINGSSMLNGGVLPMFSGGGGIYFEHEVAVYLGDSGVYQKLVRSRIVSRQLSNTPNWPRLSINVFANSDRKELAANPTLLTGYQSLAWYGQDGVLVGGEGYGPVTSVTDPNSPGFGKYSFWNANILTIYT